MTKPLFSVALILGVVSTAHAGQSRGAAKAEFFNLMLDGRSAGWSEASSNLPPGSQVKPSQTKVIIMASAGMSEGLYEWIRASFDTGHVTKSGEIHACDSDYKSISMRQFVDASITSVTLPALDKASKRTANLAVEIKPKRVKSHRGNGERREGRIALARKQWLASNFRLTIGDLPTARVHKVANITLKRGLFSQSDPDGLGRIKVTFPTQDLAEWQRWLKVPRSAPKRGMINVASSDGTQGYAVNFSGLRILRIAPERGSRAGRVQNHVAEMQFQHNETDFNFVSR
jgi:hypothetical protein